LLLPVGGRKVPTATEGKTMYTVRDILRTKGNAIWSLPPQATAFEALKLMAEKNVGALLIIESGKVVGIFSERDYARKVALEGKTSKTTTVGELMTSDVMYVNPDYTIEDCMALMTEKRHRHLPVLESGKLVGVISIGDVVKNVIADREFTIRQLERYITGGHTSMQ
jgi:IMP dehydrogenase